MFPIIFTIENRSMFSFFYKTKKFEKKLFNGGLRQLFSKKTNKTKMNKWDVRKPMAEFVFYYVERKMENVISCVILYLLFGISAIYCAFYEISILNRQFKHLHKNKSSEEMHFHL